MARSYHNQRISATDITKCLRGLVYKKRGVTAPALHPDIQRTLERFHEYSEAGQAIQRSVTAFWRRKGCLVNAGDFLPNEAPCSGRYDALCQMHGGLTLYEIKGAGQQFFTWVRENRKPRPYHVVQTMLYHAALLPQYPGLQAKILYVSRARFKQGTLAGVEIPVSYTEADYRRVLDDMQAVHNALAGGTLPPAWPAIEVNPQTGKPDIAMNALTCRHHALCLDDEQWYAKAKRKLGMEVPDAAPAPSDGPVDAEELPF